MSSCSYSSFKRSCNRACGSKSRFLCGSSGRFLSNIRSSFSRSFSSSSQAPLREPPRGGVAHAHALAVPLAALSHLQKPKWNNQSRTSRDCLVDAVTGGLRRASLK
ncbi:hypothetical protein CEP51_016783 [Fusarium floridanum]|uniref:Uncharacterized protein n=2 Tax=Fusarium solani species complex TaxID=232080 RepID=A0A428NFW5_9HYPO|nr:hypothetical protein CEP51_016783 [Fusarium floridanum]